MAVEPAHLTEEMLTFLSERHLATLSLAAPSGLHVTPVGFTYDEETMCARIITFATARKVRLIEQQQDVGLEAAVCQVDGGRWMTLHGTATVTADAATNADAERRYADRYRPPKDRGADRRTIEIVVTRILGRA